MQLIVTTSVSSQDRKSGNVEYSFGFESLQLLELMIEKLQKGTDWEPATTEHQKSE